MLTHDCPTDILPLVKIYSGVNNGAVTKSQMQLGRINYIADIKKWYFGHWHIDKILDNKFECLYRGIKEI